MTSRMGNILLTLAIVITSSFQTSLICNQRAALPPPDNGLPLCSLPIEAFPSGRPRPGSLVQPTVLPPWLNRTLAAQGQAFAAKNLYSVVFSSFVGLVFGGFPVPDSYNVLAFTGATETTDKAYRRYLATAAQLLVWLRVPFNDTDLDTNPIVVSMGHVRDHHVRAAARAVAALGIPPLVDPAAYDGYAEDKQMWAAIAADLAAPAAEEVMPLAEFPPEYEAYNGNTTAINQFMQGFTLVQFGGYVFMNPESVYIWDATDEELTAYLHIFSLIGYMIGIEDDYNVCLQPNPATTASYFRELLQRYAYPGLFQLGKIPKMLTEVYLKSTLQYFPGFDPRSLMYRFLRDQVGVQMPALKALALQNLGAKAALLEYDTVFVPTSKTEAGRLSNNLELDKFLRGDVLLYFGPYVTNQQWAESVFYPNVSGKSTNPKYLD